MRPGTPWNIESPAEEDRRAALHRPPSELSMVSIIDLRSELHRLLARKNTPNFFDFISNTVLNRLHLYGKKKKLLLSIADRRVHFDTPPHPPFLDR